MYGFYFNTSVELSIGWNDLEIKLAKRFFYE
jgi:hypothetical protein